MCEKPLIHDEHQGAVSPLEFEDVFLESTPVLFEVSFRRSSLENV